MAELNLDKPIVFFDLETTGLNTTSDRIVEICCIKIWPGGREQSWTIRVNPGCPIPKSASDIHGITDDDIKDCPHFEDIADEIYSIFSDADVAGFNSNRFDIPMLSEELSRAGKPLDFGKRRCIDVQTIYHKMEKRTLIAAYKHYCGKDLTEAHSAEADTRATYEVLKSQLDFYPDQLKNDMGFLAEFTCTARNYDIAGRMIINEKNEVIFNFGKYKGKPVLDVFKQDTGYYGWMMNGEFAADTKAKLKGLFLKSQTR